MNTQNQQDMDSVSQQSSGDSRTRSKAGQPAPRKLVRLVWILITVLEALLGFRFLLKLFGANPQSPFADFVYSVSAVLVSPFRNLVVNPSVGRGVFEFTTLIALLVTIFLGWLLIQLLVLLFRR
jgi:uncharacterized protein YggT (Ycf19 family)